MLIREIILENFMSYDYARIPLKSGVNIVCGPNGSGKSSILLGISVALGQSYTERSKRLSDLIRWGKDMGRVTLVLDNSKRSGRRPVPKIKKDELWIDWKGRAKDIACKVNALSPSPGARTYFDSLYVKLLRASFIREIGGEPGEIIIARNRLFVAAVEGGVEILELQPASGKPLKASAFVQGRRPVRARSGP